MVEPVRVLHVDDEPGFVELTAELLPREDGGIEVETAGSAEEGLERLEAGGIDCVVSDYDMPGTNGIEFLETVRQRYDDLPFLLYTGKGSEAVASDAISAGVTDYLQKEGGTDQYALLANRIRNAVEARLARERSRRREREYHTLIESSPAPIVVVDDAFDILYLNPSAAETIGLDDPDELVGTPALRFLHAEDETAGVERVERVLTEGDPVEAREYRLVTPGGEVRHVRGNVVPVTFEGEPAAQLVFTDVTEQKEREAALKQERRRFSALFEQFPEPVLAFGYEDGTTVVRAVNSAFVETFGYDPEVALGTQVTELIVPPTEEAQEEAETLKRRVKDGEQVDVTVCRQTADGNRWFNFRNVAVPAVDDIDGYGVYADIHERVRREEQLETLHDGTRQLLSADDPDAVAATMARVAKETLGHEYTVVRFVDEAAGQLRPVAATDVVAEVLGDRPPYPLDGDNPHARAYSEKAPVVHDDVAEIDDGTDRSPVRAAMYLPIGDHGTVAITSPSVGAFDRSDVETASILTANAQATLDRLANEREIDRVRERFQAFVEHASDIVALLDGDGVVQYQSPAIERVTGVPAAETVGTAIFEFVHPEDRAHVREQFREMVEGDGAEPVTAEYRVRAADGSWLWFESVGSGEMPGESGEYLVTSREITERKRRRQQLERQNERLDQFAGIVSHDLRNPLNVAMTRLELAETDSEHIAAAEDAVGRVEAIVDDMLALARHGGAVLETEPVDLRAVAEECWGMVAPETPPDGASPTLEIEGDASLLANRGRLKQVFENLFRNALEHSSGPHQEGDRVESDPPGADADGGARGARGGVTIRVGTLADGVSVADDGPGIPEAERETVFDPGHSTAEGGTGFGLAIVREVVDAHGWEIAVRESDGGGARFEITGIDHA